VVVLVKKKGKKRKEKNWGPPRPSWGGENTERKTGKRGGGGLNQGWSRWTKQEEKNKLGRVEEKKKGEGGTLLLFAGKRKKEENNPKKREKAKCPVLA